MMNYITGVFFIQIYSATGQKSTAAICEHLSPPRRVIVKELKWNGRIEMFEA